MALRVHADAMRSGSDGPCGRWWDSSKRDVWDHFKQMKWTRCVDQFKKARAREAWGNPRLVADSSKSRRRWARSCPVHTGPELYLLSVALSMRWLGLCTVTRSSPGDSYHVAPFQRAAEFYLMWVERASSQLRRMGKESCDACCGESTFLASIYSRKKSSKALWAGTFRKAQWPWLVWGFEQWWLPRWRRPGWKRRCLPSSRGPETQEGLITRIRSHDSF